MSSDASSIRDSMSVTVAAYRLACSWVRLHQTFISCLSGRSEMIDLSVFSRRSTNGWVIRRSSRAASSDPCRSIGTAYRSRNCLLAAEHAGVGELHDRPQLGELVLHRRAGQRDPRRRRAATLTAFACWLRWFLIACASSQTTRDQRTADSAARSRTAVW